MWAGAGQLLCAGVGDDDHKGRKPTVKIYKTTVAGVALVASLAFLAGCKSDSTSPSGSTPTSAAAAKPAEELGAAVLKLATTPHKYSVTETEGTFTASVDPTAKALKFALEAAEGTNTLKIEIISLSTDLYVKIAGLPLPGIDEKKWFHVDASKVKSLASFGVTDLTDPLGLAAMATSVKDVQKTGEGTFKGTLDLSKAAFGVDDEGIKALADKAKNIPFEATVTQGNLTRFKITVPAHGTEKEANLDVAISDHGMKPDIAKPDAASIVEAPDIVNQLLNS
jgi:hypothetical protein